MAYFFPNRVAFHVANVPGIGNFVPGDPISGFRTPAGAGLVPTNQFPYGAGDDADSGWEVGDITINSDGSLTRTVIESSNGNAAVNFSSNVIITSAPHGQQIAALATARNVKAGFLVNGGGTLSDDGSNVKWSAQFMIAGGGVGPNFATGGLFEVPVLNTGTVVTGVAGATDATAGSSGVALNALEALYYILPIGTSGAGVQGNFRKVGVAAAFDVPDSWLLIATRNNDDGSTKWCNGIILANSQSLVSSAAFSGGGTVADTPNTVVKRDGSGNIVAGAMHGSGTASIANAASGDLVTRITSDMAGNVALVLTTPDGVDQVAIWYSTSLGLIVIGDGNLSEQLTIDPVHYLVTTGYYVTTPQTVASLLAPATAGMGARSFVIDSNSAVLDGGTVAGAGANKVPVFSDGSNWRRG